MRKLLRLKPGGAASAPEYTLIEIGKGRSITGSGTTTPEIFGVRGFTPDDVTTVPTAVPTAADFTDGDVTWPFGFAAGRIFPDGAYVWVAVKANDTVDSPISIPQGRVGIFRQSVQVAISGGGGATAPVYLTWLA